MLQFLYGTKVKWPLAAATLFVASLVNVTCTAALRLAWSSTTVCGGVGFGAMAPTRPRSPRGHTVRERALRRIRAFPSSAEMEAAT